MKSSHTKWSILVALLSLTTGCLDPAIRAGRNALGQGNYNRAILHLSDAHQRFPKDDRTTRDLSSAFRALASQQADQGRCDQAGQNLTKADALTKPNLSGVRTLYRCALKSKKEPAVRERIARRLIALGDKRVAIQRQILLALFEQGREKDAVDFAPLPFRQFGLLPEDVRKVSHILCRMKRYKDCLPFLKKAMEHDNADPLLRLKAATAYTALGQIETARDIYLRLATEFPNNPVIFIRLAQFHQNNGDRDRAREALSRAHEIRGIKPVKTRVLRPLLKSRR